MMEEIKGIQAKPSGDGQSITCNDRRNGDSLHLIADHFLPIMVYIRAPQVSQFESYQEFTRGLEGVTLCTVHTNAHWQYTNMGHNMLFKMSISVLLEKLGFNAQPCPPIYIRHLTNIDANQLRLTCLNRSKSKLQDPNNPFVW